MASLLKVLMVPHQIFRHPGIDFIYGQPLQFFLGEARVAQVYFARYVISRAVLALQLVGQDEGLLGRVVVGA